MDDNKRTEWDIELIRKVTALNDERMRIGLEVVEINERVKYLVKASDNLINKNNGAVSFLQSEISKMEHKVEELKEKAKEIECQVVAWKEVQATVTPE